MEVIRYLEKLKDNSPVLFKKFFETKFIIHTWNEHAGPIMFERLLKLGLDVELIPFGM
jgi:hypothetical protein